MNCSEIARHFSKVANLGVTVIDAKGERISEAGLTCASCNICIESGVNCTRTYLYGSYQAIRFGGRYIFFCRMGLSFFASPVLNSGILEYAYVGGPFLMVELEDLLDNELKNMRHMVPRLEEVPFIPPERVHSFSEIMFVCADFTGQDRNSAMQETHENQKLQGVISEYILQIKNKNSSGFYPLEKEEELLSAMSSGDVKAAKAMLNELLGYIFFYSGFQFDVIRSRILELIVLLSRAAVKGGADAELIFGLNYEYIHEIDNFKTTEDLAYWLSGIMNRFTDYVFNFVGVKHADVIYKATDYIRTRYMDKITLDDTANHVYLSAPYFSKVFKEETKCNFNQYLNKVRIEHAKKLLLNQNIPLADISNLVGYEDQSYFSKVFKKLSGLSPLKYRQSRGK